MSKRNWTTAILMTATAAVILAGCGGGGGSKATAKGASSNGEAGASTITVVAKDFMFEPAALNATAGKPVTVTIKNEGQAEHNFSITDLKVNQDVEKGDTKTVTFTPTQSGTIQFFCEYHKASHGMVGTLNVA